MLGLHLLFEFQLLNFYLTLLATLLQIAIGISFCSLINF